MPVQHTGEAYLSTSLYSATSVANLRTVTGGTGSADGRVAMVFTSGADVVVFRWDPADTTADNGTTIIKPTEIDASDPGRWRTRLTS